MEMQAILIGAILGAIVCGILPKFIKGFGANVFANSTLGAWGGIIGAVAGAAIASGNNNVVYISSVVFSLIALSGMNFLKRFN